MRPKARRGLEAAAAASRLAVARLALRGPLWIASVALALSAVVGLAEHAAAPLDAPARALSVVLGWVVPLSCFGLVSLSTARRRLDDGLWCLATHGLGRSWLVLGLVLPVALLAAGLSLACAGVALSLAYQGLPGLLEDLLVSSWIAALGAAAYVAWFVLGASFLRHGRGRWLVLAADFAIGGGSGVLAVCWPRGHLRSLAGGQAVLELPQRTSSVLLGALAASLLLLAAWRAGD